MRRVAAFAILLTGTTGTTIFAAPPDPCSLISTVTDAKVTIAILDGRATFREGEVIPLVLSFTSRLKNAIGPTIATMTAAAG